MATASTELGYVNRNDQMVLRKPGRPGNDRIQEAYVMRCLECQHEYEATESDTPVCHCPSCDGGRQELAEAA